MRAQRRVPFFDLHASLAPIMGELHAAWTDVVESGAFVGGPAVSAFEEQFAAYSKAEHCVGVANGTDAIELVLRALGISSGDEVLVPANTFVATAEAVVNVGATVTFADVDPATLLMRPCDAEAAMTDRTTAIIPVHLYGQMCDMVGFRELADRANVALIEDAAQAHGASVDGYSPGALSAAATFSFYPGKNLGALGDGGAVLTNRADLESDIRCLAAHGRSAEDRYLHDKVGRNSRLDGMQAAFLSARLPQLEAENTRRREVRELYSQHLPESVVLVDQAPGRVCSDHLIVAQVDDRDEFRQDLETRGVATGLHYPRPCHLQVAFVQERLPWSMPVAEAAASRIVSLPVWGQMPDDDVDYVCRQIREVVG